MTGPVQALRLLLVGAIMLYSAKLGIGRAIVYYHEYGKASALHALYANRVLVCGPDGPDSTKHAFSDGCAEAEIAVHRWPALVALGELARQTHSCIEFPCSDVARGLLDSWTAQLAVAGVLAAGAMRLMGAARRWRVGGGGKRKRNALGLEHESELHAMTAPYVHHRPDTKLQLPDASQVLALDLTAVGAAGRRRAVEYVE
jgi:hypothetical protein